MAGGGLTGLDFTQMLEDGSIRDVMPGGIPVVEAMDFNSMPISDLMNGAQESHNVKRGTRA